MRILFVIAISLAIAAINGYPQNLPSTLTEDQLAAATDEEVDVYAEALEQHAEETSDVERLEGSQTFYPSFAPIQNQPHGHSRPFYQQEGAYSQRPAAYQQHVGFDSTARFSGYKDNNFNGQATENQGLLGSGNFGVITGGTFYNDNDGDSTGYDPYKTYYQNGHGRPSSFYRPRKYQQFENFRDFADINVPANQAFSHYVVVYANKNGSKFEPEEQKNKPKNIMEHLALLDLEATTTAKAAPTKKLSKSKRKLANTLPEKKQRIKKTTTTSPQRDLYEPLLALS